MAAREPKRSSEKGRMARQFSIGMSIPTMMGAGPLVGAGLGWAAIKYFGAPKWAMALGILIGFAAGIRETIRLIKRLEK